MSTPADAPVRWLTREEFAAWRGLLRMHAQLAARLNRELSSASELSLQDYGVLAVLSEQRDGRLRAFELGRELGWEKSRLSHHIERMERRGLVSRQQCPTDRRGLNVAVTAEGKRALEAAAPAHLAQVRRAFIDLLTPAQIASMADISATIVAAVGRECDADPDRCDRPGGAGPDPAVQ
jgi:DNA-binding MarR family transcriptional regulator